MKESFAQHISPHKQAKQLTFQSSAGRVCCVSNKKFDCQNRQPLSDSPLFFLSTANKMSANLLGGTAIKPPERHGFEAFKWFMYDPDKAILEFYVGRVTASVLY